MHQLMLYSEMLFDLDRRSMTLPMHFCQAKRTRGFGKPLSLRLRSTPSGADVRIDGRSYGPTPVEAIIPSGRHLVELELEGYRSLREEITIGGSSETLRYSLERESRALRVQPPPPPSETVCPWLECLGRYRRKRTESWSHHDRDHLAHRGLSTPPRRIG